MRVSAAEDGVAVGKIARELDIPAPTAHHLLETLTAEGLLAKSDRLYTLGPKVGVLSDAYSALATPPAYLRDPLERLADVSGETAYLSAWRDDDAVVLATVEGQHAVRVASLSPGFRGATYARAAGKVLLAFGRPEITERFLASHMLERRTPSTITSKSALLRELDEIRGRGYGFDREEFSEGAIGVAAPVLESGVAIAAYALTAPVARFHEREGEYVAAVLDATRSAQTRIS